MARRRKFYARDRSGRFARTAGSKAAPIKKKGLSRNQKIAIAGGVVAVSAAVAYGASEIYRSGANKGYETGIRHAKENAKPVRDNKGRITGRKRTPRSNPFGRSLKKEASLRIRQGKIIAKDIHGKGMQNAGYRLGSKYVKSQIPGLAGSRRRR